MRPLKQKRTDFDTIIADCIYEAEGFVVESDSRLTKLLEAQLYIGTLFHICEMLDGEVSLVHEYARVVRGMISETIEAQIANGGAK